MREGSSIDDAIRILVVDDDPQTARLVRSWYTGKPFVVLEAPDGEKGVALARSEQPDVILLDVVMPGLDGLAVAGRYAWSDKLGTALRLEYVKDDRAYFGFPDDAQIWSITATTDYSLTEHLIVKGEIRHDGGTVRRNSDHLFIDSDDEVPGIFTNPNQTLFGAQVIYTF